MQRETRGSASPEQGGGKAAEPVPFGLGGHRPPALPGRPGQENHHEGRAGEKQRVASGQGRRIEFHSQEDTPIPPRFVWKAAGAKVWCGQGTPLPRRAGGQQK